MNTEAKVFELIAETLIEIRDELRRNRPPVLDVSAHPERVRRVKDGKRPNEPYVRVTQESTLSPMMAGDQNPLQRTGSGA